MQNANYAIVFNLSNTEIAGSVQNEKEVAFNIKCTWKIVLKLV